MTHVFIQSDLCPQQPICILLRGLMSLVSRGASPSDRSSTGEFYWEKSSKQNVQNIDLTYEILLW